MRDGDRAKPADAGELEIPDEGIESALTVSPHSDERIAFDRLGPAWRSFVAGLGPNEKKLLATFIWLKMKEAVRNDRLERAIREHDTGALLAGKELFTPLEEPN